MLGSYSSASSQARMKALNWNGSLIVWAKLTPVLQLTDTDMARRLKIIAENKN